MNKKGGTMIQFNFESTTSIGKHEPYNNVAAHEELEVHDVTF